MTIRAALRSAPALVCHTDFRSRVRAGRRPAAPAAAAKTTASRPVATPSRLARATTSVPIGSPLKLTYNSTSRRTRSSTRTTGSSSTCSTRRRAAVGRRSPAADADVQWKPGQKVEYTRTVFVPNYPYIGRGVVRLGLYDPKTSKRLTLAGEHGVPQGVQGARSSSCSRSPRTSS